MAFQEVVRYFPAGPSDSPVIYCRDKKNRGTQHSVRINPSPCSCNFGLPYLLHDKHTAEGWEKNEGAY